jgi:hypothetical protein
VCARPALLGVFDESTIASPLSTGVTLRLSSVFQKPARVISASRGLGGEVIDLRTLSWLLAHW